MRGGGEWTINDELAAIGSVSEKRILVKFYFVHSKTGNYALGKKKNSRGYSRRRRCSSYFPPPRHFYAPRYFLFLAG